MKNKILSLIALAAIFACGSAMAVGDIYDIRACKDAIGRWNDCAESELPLYTIDSPMVVGDDMYFKVRFIPRDQSGATWNLTYTGPFSPEMAKALTPLQMGIFVGGTNRLEFASCIETLESRVGPYTCLDLVFTYKVQPGDFALPIVTASIDERGNVVPTFNTDPKGTGYRGYYINPGSYQWKIYYGDTKQEAVWAISSQSFSPVPMRDLYLRKAGYVAKTVDFDKGDDYKKGDVWREVHQGSALTVNADPRIALTSVPTNSVRMYVWSTNENAVVVYPSSKVKVEKVTMKDPVTQKDVTYSVGEIVIEGGQQEAEFKIWGVSKTANGGNAGLVLSAYNHFNYENLSGDLIPDTLTIPVKCIDELPPTVSVRCDREVVYADEDYKEMAAQFTITASQALPVDVDVALKPMFADGEGGDEKWPDYMRFSTTGAFPSTSPDPSAYPTVRIPAGQTSADFTICLFALRSDDRTRGVGHGIAFKPIISDAQKAAAGIQLLEDALVTVQPAPARIIVPAEGVTLTPQPVRNDDYALTLQVNGTYADLNAGTTAGYKIYVRYPNKTFAALAGEYYVDSSDSEVEGGILKLLAKDPADGKMVKTETLPVLKFPTAGDDQTVEIYVVPPVSGSLGKSATRTVLANVKDLRSIVLTTTDGTENEYNEGATVNIKIKLSENSYDNPIYAFLRPVDSAYATNSLYRSVKGGSFMTCGMNGSDSISGIPIASPETEVTASFMFLDGYSRDNGGLNAGFEVILSEEQTSTNKVIKGFNSNQLNLTVYNVEPELTRFELNGVKYNDGDTATTKYPLGQDQVVKAIVKDVQYDLDNNFTCRWTPYCDDIPQEDGIKTIVGNPSNCTYTNNFPIAGHWKIELEIKDKDMSDWKATSYALYLDVVDQPQVSISAPETLDETARTQKILVGLGGYYDSSAAGGKPMDVMIHVIPPTGANPGEFKLAEEYRNTDPLLGPTEEGYYIIQIKDTKEHEIPISSLDGTMLSEGSGFKLEAYVVTKTVNPRTGVPWCDYYLLNSTKSYVLNVAPNNNDADGKAFSPLGDINTPSGRVEVAASRATERKITWRFRNDVEADMKAGVTIHISGGGGENYNEDGFTNGVKTVTESASGTYVPDFSGLTGDQQVMIEIEDKDGGNISQTWYFTIIASKTLNTFADGPSGGTDKQLSVKYQGAAGLGKGHVFIPGYSGVPGATQFRLSWNCGRNNIMYGYAYGYRVGAIDNGQLNGGNDIPIDSNGNTWTTGDPYYQYDDKTLDSFLYAWLKPTSAEGGDSEATINVTPEFSDGTVSAAEIRMPAQEASGEKDGSGYLPVTVEAVFSKEYIASDNIGDINADGIPDLYIANPYYDFTVDYSLFRGEGSDMASFKNMNDDEDFLPIGIGGTAIYPNFNGATEFTAYQEIRGLGDGLNNAPALAGITGAKPDPDFTDLELKSARTLGYTSAKDALDHGWSPERPSNPTVEDTDEDGFPDGYEYWFWYRAHVGYLDNGQIRRIQGEKYNPLHPEKGDVITWQEIEKVFDPITVNAEAADDINLVDTDNDGLPDILEFALGTNPIHWDTDGDGLPDGWEVLRTNLDPLKAATDDTHKDGTVNPDHDFMASMTLSGLTRITSVDAAGRAVHYATPIAYWDIMEAVQVTEEPLGTGWKVRIGEKDYIIKNGDLTESQVYVKVVDGEKEEYYLANDFKPTEAFAVSMAPGVAVRGLGAILEKGTKLDSAPVQAEWYEKRFVGFENSAGGMSPIGGNDADFERRGYSVWQYGKDGGYVMAGNKDVAVGTVVVEVAVADIKLLHHHVYQWRGFKLATDLAEKYGTLDERWDMGTGFDPTTAWNVDDHGYVHHRWWITPPSKPLSSFVRKIGYGATGMAADTEAYTTLDEYLLMNFRQHCGQVAEADLWADLHASPQKTYASIWAKNTTFPNNQTSTTTSTTTVTDEEGNTTTSTTDSASVSGWGADTDGDGVPDGWELYVSCGPYSLGNVLNNTLAISPLYNEIANNRPMDVDEDPIAGPTNPPEGDGLSYVAEFLGTDSMIAYADVDTIATTHPSDEHWLNKFWPTDPWSTDTDCDGVADGAESAGVHKVYSGMTCEWPADTGTYRIEGAGMNPCSWDTDQDGLPDPWELQYIGQYIPSTFYCTDVYQYRGYQLMCAMYGLEPSAAIFVNPAEEPGFFVGGMDPSVPDSYSETEYSLSEEILARRPLNINRDYDFDGLQNWQEYLTCTIRAFRYDDVLSPWKVPQKADFGATDEEFLDALVTGAPLNPLTDGGSNPNLVFGAFDSYAAYGSKCRRGWDLCYDHYYFFPDGVNHILRKDSNKLFTKSIYGQIIAEAGLSDEIDEDVGPVEYATCDPRDPDSDGDGMDDYYELFHGLNPLYGGKTGLDLISMQWGAGISAENNYWQLTRQNEARGDSKEKKARDFAIFPWMAGDPAADPDGDDIRNVDESIKPNIEANLTWLHTDPTPLWMTDTSSAHSLVNGYYRPPVLSLQWDGEIPRQIDGRDLPDVSAAPSHRWLLITPYNWAFEENDGYDSDHDGLSDYHEAAAKATATTDPQDEDDPRRRQAMYFTGDRSALQAKDDPIFGIGSSELFFLEFTVECWVRPERVGGARQTILERVVTHGASNPGDRRYYRRNFQLGIDETGHYYAAYDSNGTGVDRVIATSERTATADAWTHLAATYDGRKLVLFIDGVPFATTVSELHPAISGESAYTTLTYDNTVSMLDWDFDIWSYLRSITTEHAIIVGASAIEQTGSEDSKISALALDSKTSSWDAYDSFYQGYLDEVRIWDGARSEGEIRSDYKARYTFADVAANQKAVYKAWLDGARRDVTNLDVSNQLPPELAYHYTFDGLFSALSPEFMATEPNGFNATIENGGKALCARPEGYVCQWWADLPVHSLVYGNYAYVPWIPNTLAHLPRIDGTVLDSVYWSEDFVGFKSAAEMNYEKFDFPKTHELCGNYVPVVTGLGERETRNAIVLNGGTPLDEHVVSKQNFVTREEKLYTTDLLPLGNAYVRYCEDMWDGEGPSTVGDPSGKDVDFDYLPDWWEALQPGFVDLTTYDWETPITRNGLTRTAGEWYRIDIAAGAHETATGGTLADETYKSVADVDHDGMADWWEDFYGIDTHNSTDGFADVDNDGLSNYAEFLVSEVFNYAVLSPTNPRSDGFIVDYFRKFGDLYLGEVFTDHDQVNDDWEGRYPEFANRSLYDPSRDEDHDGWSNYAEYRAGTDPSKITAMGIEEYTKNEYPVPVIEAKVVYNGNDISLGQVVFKAWNEESDPDMNSVPDAIWTFGNGEAVEGDRVSTGGSSESGSSLVDYEKYIGKKPSGVQRYVLSGGAISEGSVRIAFCNPNFSIITFVDDVPVSMENGYPDDAEWFYNVFDKGGKLVHSALFGDDGEEDEIGTIDYKTGVITIDFDTFTGLHFGDYSSIASTASGSTETDAEKYYVYDIETSYVRIQWSAKLIGLTVNNTYYLSDSDVVSEAAKSHGHIREGKNTFVCYLVGGSGASGESSGEGEGASSITPGTPFGVVRGVDVGWQGAKFTVEIGETCGISPRIALWADVNDRDEKIDGANDVLLNDRTLALLNAQSSNSLDRAYWAQVVSNRVDVTPPQKDKVRVRVVRYGVDDMFYYMVAGLNPEPLIDKMFDANGRDFLCEADFLGDGIFDLDWETLKSEVVDNSAVKAANLPVTNMTYLVVIGDGEKAIHGSTDTNSVIRALGSVVTRRFEKTQSRPKAIGVIGGGDVVDRGIVFSARPTFVWSVPNEDAWAKRFGTTYTAFKIRVKDAKTGELIYNSGVVRAPAQEPDGSFRWMAPITVGAQTPQGKLFKNAANYTWDVAMYNAKFKPSANETDVWSSPDEGRFSTDVNMQQALNDRGFSSVDVSVKYAGPKAVLEKCGDLTDLRGKVRVQAFTTADFSGEPLSETQVTDFGSLVNLLDQDVNATLIGLPADGTYYVRAYIDMNGNFKKDDFESWGYAKDSAALSTTVSRKPALSIFIEDADTNGNWHPDAWEYAYLGEWEDEWEIVRTSLPAKVESDGKITISPALVKLVSNVTRFSSGMSGATLTTFSEPTFAGLVLSDPDSDSVDVLAAVRRAVDKGVVPTSLMVTDVEFDVPAGKVALSIDCAVDYINADLAEIAKRIYVLDESDVVPVTVKVLKKTTLAQADWDVACEIPNVMLGKGVVELQVSDNGAPLDPTGCYKVVLEEDVR